MPLTQIRARAIPSALRSELEEAAFNHGYRRFEGEADGWLYFRSDIDVPGEIGLAVAADGAAWFLCVEHPGVAGELDAPAATPVPANMRAAFVFMDQSAMRAALHRAYVLATTLPTMPLHEFEAAVAGLGNTEADRLTRIRIGQDHFRRHIVPWAECASDAERLDVHNGLLLAAHWDAAFDAGLVSFGCGGEPLFSSMLGSAARVALGVPPPLRLTEAHREKLIWHRSRYGFDHQC